MDVSALGRRSSAFVCFFARLIRLTNHYRGNLTFPILLEDFFNRIGRSCLAGTLEVVAAISCLSDNHKNVMKDYSQP